MLQRLEQWDRVGFHESDDQQFLYFERTLIMTPAEYESQVAALFAGLGYSTRQTAMFGDYGVDVFAENADERLAIQVKMYGHTTRRVNRQMVMELYGAKDYFDCHKAVLVTDGEFLPDALEVAEKLGIQVLSVPAAATPNSIRSATAEPVSSGSLSSDEAPFLIKYGETMLCR